MAVHILDTREPGSIPDMPQASSDDPFPQAESTTGPTADAVRLALPAEATELAEIQRRCWAADYRPELAERLAAELSVAEMTQGWHAALVAPPDARCRVLVSHEPGRLTGFAVTLPSSDPDADPGTDGLIGEWLVDPPARRRGHGSRLLNAAVDTLRADGFDRATVWLATTDDDRRRLLSGSGWAPDGSHREIGPDPDLAIKQVRLHTDISPED